MPKKHKPSSSRQLTPRQQAFVREYLIDLVASDAAIRAGFSAKSAKAIAFNLMQRPAIAAAIKAGMEARERRTYITQDRVLQEIARIAFADVRSLYDASGALKAPKDLTPEAAAALAAVDVSEVGGGDAPVIITKKAKLHDKVAALTLAARHLGMLNDKLKLDVETTVIVKDYTGRKAVADPSA
jgi:phage terminase small subunit